ncbi:hypothetical protein F751_3098 [Auxenochlorella protothecoides]|uniref:Uncharacterized protein n=1 Tax=Auxenochlorella protothecoides TaxID=3075 RepID=A0A087SF76_AUXPR|nr:hypothetical protein F751_3098 [Auxenochlorella protothecoides]KFM24380.1 hypothetical protein F751_3098 [Auxenochlorella protothecoides]
MQARIPTDRISDFLRGESRQYRTAFNRENRRPDRNWAAKAYFTCARGPDKPIVTARSTENQRLQPTNEVREMSIKTGCQHKFVIKTLRQRKTDSIIIYRHKPHTGQDEDTRQCPRLSSWVMDKLTELLNGNPRFSTRDLTIVIQNIVRKEMGWPERKKLQPAEFLGLLRDFPDRFHDYNMSYQDIA